MLVEVFKQRLFDISGIFAESKKQLAIDQFFITMLSESHPLDQCQFARVAQFIKRSLGSFESCVVDVACGVLRSVEPSLDIVEHC